MFVDQKAKVFSVIKSSSCLQNVKCGFGLMGDLTGNVCVLIREPTKVRNQTSHSLCSKQNTDTFPCRS